MAMAPGALLSKGGMGTMRGLWWSAVAISGLLGGITGAALLFGLSQAFGTGSSGSHSSGGASNAVRVSDTRSGAVTLARNGIDAGGIYTHVRPSIVTINTTTIQRRRRDDGEGTGIILDGSGRILTNNHVIDGVSRIQVVLSNGRSYDGTVLATDPDNDLAVIGISAAGLAPATLGDPSTLHIGDPVVAIGNPLGYEASLTEGIVSGLDRTFNDSSDLPPISHLIQSDAAINPGNSGGPLLNSHGDVVGVNTLLDNADGTNSFAGIGFAVPISAAQNVIKQAQAKR